MLAITSGAVLSPPIVQLLAAMPQLHQAAPAALGDDERLVRAYLDLMLMLMRVPDRLTFTVEIEPALRGLAFPQLGLLTLVENVVRHGSDAGCDPGHIDVGARRGAAGELQLRVADTGLHNLRARLQAFFGPDASVELSEQAPHGVLRADQPLGHRQPGAGAALLARPRRFG